jgi:ribosomal protein S18 acetylase RimI-like enzyme
MTPEELLRVSEDDNFSFWAEFARRPGGALGTESRATWYRSGVPFASYNGVLGAGCDIDAMLARVRAWGLPARWLVCSTSAGTAEAMFAERGLMMTDEYPGMVAHLKDLPVPTASDVTCEAVTSERQRLEWDDAFHDGFGLSREAATIVAEAHAWPHRHECARTYLLLRRHGTAVATGMLHSACGVAGIYGIAVRRQYRRQGLGELATLCTAHAGAERGATMAVLQATEDGLPVYEKLGFRTVCAFRSWRIV